MLKKLPQRDLWLAVLLGAATTLAFAPFDYKWISPLALALLIGLSANAGSWRAFVVGWLFGLASFASGIHWIFISTHVYGGAPAWLGLLLCAVLFSYMALYPALVMGLSARLRLFRHPLGWLAVPMLWVLSELLRAWVFTGFPWLSLGYIATDTAAARLAPLIGVYGISGVAVMLAMFLFWVAAHSWATLRVVSLLLIPVLWAALYLLPQPSRWTEPVRAPLSVAIVQGNIAQDQKWLREMQQPTIQRYYDMTLAALDAELVVWPEVALTQRYDEIKDNLLVQLDSAAREKNSALIAGMMVWDDAKRGVYNSLITVGAAQGRYDKHHLVPFGEFFPIPDWLRPLMDVLGTPYSDFLFGERHQPPLKVKAETLGLSICFEDVFGDELRDLAATSSLFVTVTNDAWFGRSPAAEQHLQIARLRALENGRAIVRASNTGRSAVIGPDGDVQASAGFFTTELLRAPVQPRAGLTPYARYGDAPLWVSSALLLLVLAWRQRAKKMPAGRA